jgi:hypothetical protein
MNLNLLYLFFYAPLFLINNAPPVILPQLEAEEHVTYYATIALRESPFPAFKGLTQLTANEAQYRNHYQFVKDSGFRLKAIIFRLGDQVRDVNHTANYFLTTPEIRISYSGDQEVRTFYDRFGNQVKQRGTWKEVFTKDELGRNKSLHFEDESGQQIENDWGIYTYQWEVKNDGSVVENRYNQKGIPVMLRPGFDFYTIRLTYESNGSLALMQNIDDQGDLVENSSGVAQDKLHFDEQGRWLGWTVLDAQHQKKSGNGPNVAKGINTSDEYGYETSIYYENEFGVRVRNTYGFWGSRRFYDKFGNYDYTQFIDQTGNPGLHEKAGYSIAQYTWTRDGLLPISVQLLGLNKEPVLHKNRGYATIKHQHDSEGRLIKTSYHGLRQELINRTDNGVAYIVYEYSMGGEKKSIQRFNKDSQPLP